MSISSLNCVCSNVGDIQSHDPKVYTKPPKEFLTKTEAARLVCEQRIGEGAYLEALYDPIVRAELESRGCKLPAENADCSDTSSTDGGRDSESEQVDSSEKGTGLR